MALSGLAKIVVARPPKERRIGGSSRRRGGSEGVPEGTDRGAQCLPIKGEDDRKGAAE